MTTKGIDQLIAEVLDDDLRALYTGGLCKADTLMNVQALRLYRTNVEPEAKADPLLPSDPEPAPFEARGFIARQGKKKKRKKK